MTGRVRVMRELLARTRRATCRLKATVPAACFLMETTGSLACPSCGQRTPATGACAACGAQSTPRLGLGVFRLLAIVLAVAGLLAVREAGLARELPVTPIGRIDPAMNSAYARVQGRVTRPPSYDPGAQSLGFWVDDGTGELRVGAYRGVLTALLAQGRVPQAGDWVDLAGSLRVRQSEEYVTLTINVPEHVRLTPPAAQAASLAAASAGDALTRVHVRARVTALREAAPGLHVLALRDASGRLGLTVSSDAVALGGVLPAVRPGDSVAVTATVTLYRGESQLSLGDTRDLAVLPAGSVAPPEAAVGALGPDDLERWVRVRGTLAEPVAFTGGRRFTLRDGTGSALVILWDDLYAGTAAPELLPGASVEVVAVVDEYHGRLELVPELAEDLTVLAPPPTPTPAPTPTPLRPPASTHAVTRTPAPTATAVLAPRTPHPTSQTPEPLTAIGALVPGTRAAVEARVIDASNFPAGFKFVLDDGTGRVVLLVWQDDYAYIPGVSGLRPGARVRASGEVQSYEGTLELVPGGGRDIGILAAGTGPAAELRVIHTITGADVNTWQAIEGQVVNVKTFRSGARVYVDDGSGSIEVLLWNTVWERVPGRERIGPGVWVRVVGLVQVYEGRVELVPALPAYVEVR